MKMARLSALMDKVCRPYVGSRHRRWSVLTKEVIGGERVLQKVPLITRYRLIVTPRGGLFLHELHRPDADPDCHNHPWVFRTLVLSGGYVEECRARADGPAVVQALVRSAGGMGGCPSRRYRRFPLEAAHRIVSVLPDTWTLVLVGPKVRDWGFFVQENRPAPAITQMLRAHGETRQAHVPDVRFVPWRAYIAAGGKSRPFDC